MKLNLKRLRAERIAQGLSQEDMSNLMGWKGRGPYAKRENGLVNIGADELAHMAEILGYEAKDLGIFFTMNVPKRERIN